MSIMLIRMHENRVRYDWGGWLQWKPILTKQWYMMHSHAIEPRKMCELFVHKYLPKIEEERAVVKIIGSWDRKTKRMKVEEIVGFEQT